MSDTPDGPCGPISTRQPPPGARSPGRPRDERASQAITEAALRQLADVGYAKISMESVASEAGVSRATVYRRYRDKADLITAAIADHATEVPTGPSDDPKMDLARFLPEFDDCFAASGMGMLGSLLAAQDDPRALELHRERVVAPRAAYARRLLEQAQGRGDLRPDADLDLAIQMLAGSVFHRRVSGMRGQSGWATRAVDAIWKGMGGGRASDPDWALPDGRRPSATAPARA